MRMLGGSDREHRCDPPASNDAAGIAEFERLTGRYVHLCDVNPEVELSVNDGRARSDRLARIS
jgi:hypothetical protein